MAIVPSLHKKYLSVIVDRVFCKCSERFVDKLKSYALNDTAVNMEEHFSQLTLDVIGLAVFNYNFDSLTSDSPVIESVYTALKEAEARSTDLLPYWKICRNHGSCFFSRRLALRMAFNSAVHGWGLDFALRKCIDPAYERIGVVDAQWITHQGVPSLGNQGKENNGKAPWEGVRERCKNEWKVFQDRLAKAERDHYKSVGVRSTKANWVTPDRIQ